MLNEKEENENETLIGKKRTFDDLAATTAAATATAKEKLTNDTLRKACASYNAPETIARFGHVSEWVLDESMEYLHTLPFGPDFNEDISN